MSSPFVPYDPSIDTPMGYRHLLLIYCVVWAVQLAYGGYAVLQWKRSRKNKSE